MTRLLVTPERGPRPAGRPDECFYCRRPLGAEHEPACVMNDPWQEKRLEDRNYAFLQWKGTQVCMDLYCVCGEQWHLDEDFTYAVRCPHCRRVFKVEPYVRIHEVPEDEVHSEIIEADPGEALPDAMTGKQE